MPPLSLLEIEVKWRAAGSGICVIVEGETEQDDPWYYNKWFSTRAREITFFPQNGWERVIDAVATLRTTLGNKKVYGIIDRDFEVPEYDPFPANGILRTRKYTLENYLLNPVVWHQLAHPYVQRTLRVEWDTVAAVQTLIDNLYRQCIPMSAYNATLRQARLDNPTAFATLGRAGEYAQVPQNLTEWGDIPTRLCQIQVDLGPSRDLAQYYIDRQTMLREYSFAQLEEVVTGKPIKKYLLPNAFPLRLSGKQAWNDMLGAYMTLSPAPPDDLQTLIEAILADAHA